MQCTLCLSTDIGDEFHYIFVCPYFQREGCLYLSKKFCKSKLPSAMHMTELFNTKSTSQLKNLARFTRLIMLKFNLKKQRKKIVQAFQEVQLELNLHVLVAVG